LIEKKKKESKQLSSNSKEEDFKKSTNSIGLLDESILVESPESTNNFQFSDYDEDDDFEDSREIQSDGEDNFFTPINFKSTYAINWTKLAPKSSSTPAPKSASTPDLRPAGKRPAPSPTDSDANVNKKICGPSALKI
jgi:hypothetical protein